ncbi:MAG: hypothetical protein ACRYFZ_26900 [Janthinobacterium lividum]
MKKFLFLGACLAALASQPVRAQVHAPQVTVVRLTFTGTRLITTISRGEGKTETTDIDVPISIAKNSTPMAEAYQRVLAKLTQEDYLLKGMSGGDAITTVVFMKD